MFQSHLFYFVFDNVPVMYCLDCWNGQNKKNGGGNNHQQQHLNNQHGVHGERFGSYRCDSTWQLVVSAVQAMKSITGEDIEFLLWTGYINLFTLISNQFSPDTDRAQPSEQSVDIQSFERIS